jgi:hypothetical protein
MSPTEGIGALLHDFIAPGRRANIEIFLAHEWIAPKLPESQSHLTFANVQSIRRHMLQTVTCFGERVFIFRIRTTFHETRGSKAPDCNGVGPMGSSAVHQSQKGKRQGFF